MCIRLLMTRSGVQVMSLLAYLMQHKGACGPHLIIVPNAVMVNWKSELLRWLPSKPLQQRLQGVGKRPSLPSQEIKLLRRRLQPKLQGLRKNTSLPYQGM